MGFRAGVAREDNERERAIAGYVTRRSPIELYTLEPKPNITHSVWNSGILMEQVHAIIFISTV